MALKPGSVQPGGHDAALEQLLEVHEQSVLEQSDKLYLEQGRLQFQMTLLECQSEASIDSILGISSERKLCCN